MAQIHCLDYHKIVENGSSSKTMNSCQNSGYPFYRVWELLSHRDFDVFSVNIDPTTPIYICHYSDSVSWRLKNSRKMALAP